MFVDGGMDVAVRSEAAPMEELFERQRMAFDREGIPEYKSRLDHLKRLRALLTDQRDRLYTALERDYGGVKSYEEFLISEVAAVVQSCDHAIKRLKGWMRPRNPGASWLNFPGTARLHPQPLGVVGIVSPWNYPVSLATWPMVGALAAGNRVMLKPSESTPHVAQLLQELLHAAFGEERVGVVTGGPEVAAAFCTLPFDHLLFTGSTRVGRKVLQAAAPNLTPVTLELGGKSPCIVAEDRFHPKRLHRTAVAIAHGKLINAGQTCIAPDYVLVPRQRAEDFAAAFEDAVQELFPTLLDNPDYGGILQPAHHQRLRAYLDEARSDGIQVRELVPAGEDFSGQDRKLPPTLVMEPPDHLELMQEEIFGPILPIRTYDSLDRAVAYVNGKPRPLALYLFSDHRRIQKYVLHQTWAGGVSVNETLVHIIEEKLPFGGVGHSGMGAYHGEAGFRTFSHLKPVFTRSFWDPMKILRPPYGPRTQKIMDWFIR